jgi:hypothetical protein
MTALLAAAALVLGTVGTFAQGKTSFAGKWTMVQDPAAAGGGGGGRGGGGRGGGGGGFACAMECTITQDATSLTVTRQGQQGEVKQTFKLDGTDSSNPGRGGDPVVSKAAWAGADLTITTGEVKQTLSIKDGNLVVTRTGPGREGTPMTTTQTYKKG